MFEVKQIKNRDKIEAEFVCIITKVDIKIVSKFKRLALSEKR